MRRRRSRPPVRAFGLRATTPPVWRREALVLTVDNQLMGNRERDVRNDRYATPTTVRGLKNRAVVVKLNRLFRY